MLANQRVQASSSCELSAGASSQRSLLGQLQPKRVRIGLVVLFVFAGVATCKIMLDSRESARSAARERAASRAAVLMERYRPFFNKSLQAAAPLSGDQQCKSPWDGSIIPPAPKKPRLPEQPAALLLRQNLRLQRKLQEDPNVTNSSNTTTPAPSPEPPAPEPSSSNTTTTAPSPGPPAPEPPSPDTTTPASSPEPSPPAPSPEPLKSTAHRMLDAVFYQEQLTGEPAALLGELATEFNVDVADEMVLNRCSPRMATPRQLCAFLDYNVPNSYSSKTSAAHRDSLAQQAFSRTCQDETGSKLVFDTTYGDVCAVALSKMYCEQALPVCEDTELDVL
eukprot:TRINITY_DN18493_c0_g1_i1.p1 TRINITY_DN18493_c0_g1~~TRINITY_DN18493_c0_g1_i1.p1  ORF type:complete len:336 (+),score=64.33 TRINITY_DN18493_c0_g1_i1:122-1129(+)